MENKIEIWKPIVGYDGLYEWYEVSNFGNVRSLNYRGEGKIKCLKTYITKEGYKFVRLRINKNKRKHINVHRLVAQAFIPNPNNLSQVNHKDEDKTNNRVDNLEWCDSKYNINYGNRTKKVIQNPNSVIGKFSSEHHNAKQILQFTKNNEFIKKWDCMMDASRELNISPQNISSCASNRKHCITAGGFKWGYADDYERIPFKVFDLEIYRKRVA